MPLRANPKYLQEVAERKKKSVTDDWIPIDPVELGHFYLPEKTPNISCYRVCEIPPVDDWVKWYEVQLFDKDTGYWHGTKFYHSSIKEAKKDWERFLKGSSNRVWKVVYISNNTDDWQATS